MINLVCRAERHITLQKLMECIIWHIIEQMKILLLLIFMRTRLNMLQCSINILHFSKPYTVNCYVLSFVFRKK